MTKTTSPSPPYTEPLNHLSGIIAHLAIVLVVGNEDALSHLLPGIQGLTILGPASWPKVTLVFPGYLVSNVMQPEGCGKREKSN